ncbi:MAG: hypothetical protein AAB036_00200, partial [Elusimicrobiota bacterium]
RERTASTRSAAASAKRGSIASDPDKGRSERGSLISRESTEYSGLTKPDLCAIDVSFVSLTKELGLMESPIHGAEDTDNRYDLELRLFMSRINGG